MDLQQQLKRPARPAPQLPAIQRKTGKPATPPAVATSWRPRARPRGFTLALSRSFEVVVPGSVPAIAQPLPNACWATVATMMIGWRDGKASDIKGAMAAVGPKWETIYTTDTGLDAADKGAFLAAAGLVAEPPQNRTIEGWETLLRKYGPLWVTTDEGGVGGFSPHARIMTAIRSEGTPETTSVDVVDPAGGIRYTEKFVDFVRKYESDVRHLATPRIQIVHWKEGAQRSTSKSYSLNTTGWSAFFPFVKGDKYEVDGPAWYNGTGEVLDASESSLRFTIDLPGQKAKLVFALTYKADGPGNTVTATVNDTRYDDTNATATTAGASRTLALSKPVTILDSKVTKLALSAQGATGRLTIWINGKSQDFDLTRKKS
jgi:hypothetical protein